MRQFSLWISYIHTILRILYSVQQYVLLRIPYLEKYLYTKLGTAIRGSRIQARKCSYSEQDMWLYRAIRSALLQISEGIRVRIPQRFDVITFWSWNMDVVVFQSSNLDVVSLCPLKKCLRIMMSWLNFLRFSTS